MQLSSPPHISSDAKPNAPPLQQAGSSSSAAEERGVINKQPIGLSGQPALYGYLLEHTREHPLLRQLRNETAAAFPSGARMQVSPEQGAFLGWLVESLGVRSAIEMGLFTGYSALATAMALPEGGRLVACDRDADTSAMAAKYFEAAGVAHKVDVRVAPALATLQQLLEQGQHGSYDFAFIDADKRGYDDYYEAALQLVRPGGVIAIDNVLWYGKVADAQVTDKATAALRALNDKLMSDERVALSIIPVGDGIALCRKR